MPVAVVYNRIEAFDVTHLINAQKLHVKNRNSIFVRVESYRDLNKQSGLNFQGKF